MQERCFWRNKFGLNFSSSKRERFMEIPTSGIAWTHISYCSNLKIFCQSGILRQLQSVIARCHGSAFSVIIKKILRAVDHLPLTANDYHQHTSAHGSFADTLRLLGRHYDYEVSLAYTFVTKLRFVNMRDIFSLSSCHALIFKLGVCEGLDNSVMSNVSLLEQTAPLLWFTYMNNAFTSKVKTCAQLFSVSQCLSSGEARLFYTHTLLHISAVSGVSVFKGCCFQYNSSNWPGVKRSLNQSAWSMAQAATFLWIFFIRFFAHNWLAFNIHDIAFAHVAYRMGLTASVI